MQAINLNQLQELIGSAQQSEAAKGDLKRQFRKIQSVLNNLQTALADAEGMLSPEYAPVPKERKRDRQTPAQPADAEAPYGRRADGTAKGKPGARKAAAAAAE